MIEARFVVCSCCHKEVFVTPNITSVFCMQCQKEMTDDTTRNRFIEKPDGYDSIPTGAIAV